MSRGSLLFSLILGVACVASPLRAQELPLPLDLPACLTMPVALQIFAERGYDLLLADADVQGAEGDLAGARALINPQIGAGIGHAGGHYHPRQACGGQKGCSATQEQLSVGEQGFLSDLVSGKRGLRIAVAREALAAAQAGRADAWRTLRMLVQQQFLAVAIDQKNVQFAKEVAESYAQTRELFVRRYEAGAISEADLARVETAALESEQAANLACQQERLDHVTLGFLLGIRGDTPSIRVDDVFLSDGRTSPWLGKSIGELIAYARDRRPDLAQAVARDREALASLSLQRRLRVPDFNFMLAYLQQGDGNLALQPPTYTASMNLNLPLWYQYQGEIARARAEKRAAQVGVEKLDGQIALDVASAQAVLEATHGRINRMRDHLRARAKRAWELVFFQYQKGAASLIDLLDAQRTFIQVNEEYFSDLGLYWQASFALEGALATDGNRHE